MATGLNFDFARILKAYGKNPLAVMVVAIAVAIALTLVGIKAAGLLCKEIAIEEPQAYAE